MSSSITNDLAAMTVKEKFLCMLLDKISNLEDSMQQMEIMVSDTHRYHTTKILYNLISVPKDAIMVDDTIVKRIVEAVQKDDFIIVEHAWVIVFLHGKTLVTP